MTVRQKYPVSSFISGISLLAMAVTFAACVPEEPPAPKSRLHFVTRSDDGARQILKFIDPETRQITEETSVAVNGGIWLGSAQPNGSVVIYGTGIIIGYEGIGAYYSIDENDEGRYVRRLISSNTENPEWSPSGTHFAWIQNRVLYISEPNGVRTAVATADKFTWSPDSRKIIYSKPIDEAIAAHVYDIATAQDTRVADPSYGGPYEQIVMFQWLSDNRRVIATYNSTALHHILIDTASPTPTNYQELLDKSHGFSSLTPSPANDRFVTSLYNGQPALLFTDGRAPVPLAGEFIGTGPTWSGDGSRFYYFCDLGNDGSVDAVVADSEGQTLQTFALNVADEDQDQFYVSPRQDKFAILSSLQDSNQVQLTVVELPSGDIHRFAPVAANNPVAYRRASWSPNNRYLNWGAGSNHFHVYDSQVPDTPSMSLDLGYNVGAGLWSRDSKHLAICSQASTGCSLGLVTVTAGGLTIDEYPIPTGAKLWSGPEPH